MSAGRTLPGKKLDYEALVDQIFQGRPSRAMIEIADRCNESCVHCYQVQGQKGEMKAEDIFAILDDLASRGILFLTISGGEATLRSDFLDIVRYARSLDFAITLFTNGLRIDDEMATQLAEIGLRRVDISLYSVDADVHDWVTNVPGSWEASTAAVRRLTSRGVPVKIKSPLMSPNAGTWQRFLELAESLGAEAAMDPALKGREDGERAPEQLRADNDSVRDFLRLVGGEEPGFEPDFDPTQRRLCAAAKNIHIEPDGELRPCSLLDVPLGNAKDGLARQNEAGKTLRDLRWSDLQGCSSCELARFCARCHAQSLKEVGDALAPYPDACNNAITRWELVTGASADIPERGTTLTGPFRVSGETLETLPLPPLTEAQAALYEKNSWLRRATKPAGPRAEPGQLVQIRRPGRRAKTERVPSVAPGATGTDPTA